jgi:hypothetical protein
MCLTILEILFLVAGLWLLITGKIPGKVFRLAFGKGDYRLSSGYTRLWGLLLATPLPFTIGVAALLGRLMGQAAPNYVEYFEVGYDLLVFVSAALIARKIRQRPQAGGPDESGSDQP